MVNTYDYIAIGGFAIKEINKEDYPKIKKMIKYANTKNCRVHGLGFVPKDAKEYGFYSIDSTSWVSGTRFGTIYLFKNGKLTEVKSKKRANPKKYRDGQRNNIIEWIKYQKYMNQITR